PRETALLSRIGDGHHNVPNVTYDSYIPRVYICRSISTGVRIMHALVVVANPDPRSLTHAVARRIAAGVAEGGTANSSEIADLATEGFDPRFTANDLAVHLELARPTRDVLAEQARIDHADALVLVYPVYWWSMPGLLKGWIDRVFTRGWAYDYGREAGVV